MTDGASVRLSLQWMAAPSDRELARVCEIEALCHVTPWTADQFRKALASPGVQGRVAIDANLELAGFLIARRVDRNYGTARRYRWLEISNLAVHPSCWRQGVARQLVHDRLRSSIARDWDALAAIVAAQNVRACDFFFAMGFRAHRFTRHNGRGTAAAVRFVRPLTDRPILID